MKQKKCDRKKIMMLFLLFTLFEKFSFKKLQMFSMEILHPQLTYLITVHFKSYLSDQ